MIDQVNVPTVYVVDDDPQVRESLKLLMRSVGLRTEVYGSAEDFLAVYKDGPGPPRCLVLDVRMPGMSGLGLQEKLVTAGVQIPIIMITGYGDVSMAVKAMGAGAVDFIEKPFSRQALLTRVQEAIDRDASRRHRETQQGDVTERLAALSHREREVMELLIAGDHSKQIAAKLKIGEKTVAKHRARVFEKMRTDSVAALVHLAYTCDLISRVPGLNLSSR
ncbi:MAG: response regulator transcription factor [Pirellulales bacterium]|nr:response regulator transcription factor [Pirellulales bacterium]